MVASSALNCVFLEKYTTAPSPSRDYYGLKVTSSQITIYVWKISRQSGIFPTVRRESLQEFQHDLSIQNEILKIFGHEILSATLAVVGGKQDYLSHLPPKLMYRILCLLSLKDIAALSQTCSNIATEINNNNNLWKIMFYKYNNKVLSREEKKRGEISGWRKLLKAEIQKRKNHHKPMIARSNLKLRPHTETVQKKTVSLISNPETVKKTATATSTPQKLQKKKDLKQHIKSIERTPISQVNANKSKNLKKSSLQKSSKQ